MRERQKKDHSKFCSKYAVFAVHSFLSKWRRSYSRPRPSQFFAVQWALWVEDRHFVFPWSELLSCFWPKMSAMDTSMAYKTWEMSNSIETVSSVDEIFKYDRQQQQEILQAKPWQKEWVQNCLHWFCKLYALSLSHVMSIFYVFFSPHYFKNIKISALALLKMVGNCLLIVCHDITANST